jgi:sec-independent protein translocase protein TatC
MALLSFPGTKPPYDPDDEDLDQEGASGKMSFLEHLDELRQRIIKSLLALVVGFVVALYYIQPLLDFVYKPLTALFQTGKFQYTEPTEAFMLTMKLAALVGLLGAMPVILYQVWRFVAPGLYANEKKFVVPFVMLSTIFFTLGAASYETPDMTFIPRIGPVFSMYVKTILAMGIVFEMPTAVFFLAKVGVATPRWLIRNFKYAVLVIFIIAAVLTPGTDPVSQLMMAGPMLALYLLSIAIAWMVAPKR